MLWSLVGAGVVDVVLEGVVDFVDGGSNGGGDPGRVARAGRRTETWFMCCRACVSGVCVGRVCVCECACVRVRARVRATTTPTWWMSRRCSLWRRGGRRLWRENRFDRAPLQALHALGLSLVFLFVFLLVVVHRLA